MATDAALIARLDALEKKNQALEILVRDSGSLVSVRQQEEATLLAIRRKSIFQGMGEPKPNQQGAYAFRLYRVSTEKTAAGEPIIDSILAMSEEDKAHKISDGWFVNPAGVPEGKK